MQYFSEQLFWFYLYASDGTYFAREFCKRSSTRTTVHEGGMNSDFFPDKSKGFVFACSTIFCFLLDLLAFGYIGLPMVQAVLALYIVQVLSMATELRLMLLVFMLMVESCIMYDSLVLPFFYALLILFFGAYARHFIYPGTLQLIILSTTIFILQFFVEYGLLGLTISFSYFLYRLITNTLLVVLM